MSTISYQKLGSHNGLWVSGSELQTVARDTRGRKLEVSDLYEDALIYIENCAYVIFLADDMRERYFLELLK